MNANKCKISKQKLQVITPRWVVSLLKGPKSILHHMGNDMCYQLYLIRIGASQLLSDIYKNNPAKSKCRGCGHANETFHHIMCICPAMAGETVKILDQVNTILGKQYVRERDTWLPFLLCPRELNATHIQAHALTTPRTRSA
jgi:hypothetical protein